jgi:hypothetical protein
MTKVIQLVRQKKPVVIDIAHIAVDLLVSNKSPKELAEMVIALTRENEELKEALHTVTTSPGYPTQDSV